MPVPRSTCLPFFLVLILIAATTTAAQDKQGRRGLYFVAESEGIELWIPGLVNRSDAPRSGMVGEFGIITQDLYLQMYITVTAQSLEEFVEDRNKRAAGVFQGGNLKIIEKLEDCGYPTTVALHTNIDSVAGYEDKDFIVAAVKLTGNKTICFFIISAKGKGEEALFAVKWMASSLRLSGERGLDLLMAPRIVHQATGLSFRIPIRYQKQSTEGPGLICEARDETTGDDLLIRKDTLETREALNTKRKAKNTRGKPRIFTLPHPDKSTILMEFLAPAEGEKRGTARAVVQLKGERVFTVEIKGTPDRRQDLLRSAELTALGLRWIDVDSVRTRAAGAVKDLDQALRKKNRNLVKELVQILADGAFLPAGRLALEKALPMLDEADQVCGIQALAACEDVKCFPVLAKLYKNGKFKKRLTMRREVLKAFRYIRDPSAPKLLLAEAASKKPALAATALYTLGHYKSARVAILRKVLPLFKKAEALKESPRLRSRERWTILYPAFESMLKRLTGRSFMYAKDAQDWYRANKNSL